MPKRNYVSEIFGFPSSNNDQFVRNLRTKYLCPFQQTENKEFDECDPINKKSNLTDDNGELLLSHQTGACSVFHSFKGQTNEPIIICPYRFLEKDNKNEVKVFKFIQQKFFPKKEIYFVPEIGLKAYGRADWVICELEKKTDFKISDFAHLEFQSDATTGTRALVQCVRDFYDGKDITKKKYGYGLNSKASIKGSSLQMIDKGFLFEDLGKKSFWILQDTLFNILCEIFNVEMNEITNKSVSKSDTLIFITPHLEYDSSKQQYFLNVSKCFSISSSGLQKAISQKLIDKKEIIKTISEALKKKIESKNYFKINP